MKGTKFIGLLVIALIFIVLVWWLMGHLNQITVSPSPASKHINGATLPSSNSERITVTNGVSESSPKPLDVNPDVVPIIFYGKVVDEKEAPVLQADIEFGVNDASRDGLTKYHIQSDSAGLFSISGIEGGGMTVQVSKEGYYAARSEVPYFYYSPLRGPQKYTPNVNNPMLYHLRRKGLANPLIYGQKLFGFKVDGSPGYLDLVEGKNRKTVSGDVAVRIIRSVDDANHKFDYSIVLEALNGGIIESSNEFMFLAPENGYMPSVEIKQSKDAPSWSSRTSRKFYLKSRGGECFSRIEADIDPKYSKDAAGINMTYYVNLSGSRNLEYDPAKQINK